MSIRQLTIVVTQASAIREGKRIDLVQTKKLLARYFRPFKVLFGK